MTLWIVVIVAGALTLLTRLSFIALPAGAHLPAWANRALRFVPPAVLSAITFPELLIHDNALHFSMRNHRLIAGLIAIGVAWRTRQVMPTLIAGMSALWLLQWMERL